MTKITLYNKDGKKYVRIGKKKLHIPLEITNKYELIRWIIEYLTHKRKRRQAKRKPKVNPLTGHIDSLDEKRIKERLRLEELEQKKRDKFIEEQQSKPPPKPPKKRIQKKPKPEPEPEPEHKYEEPKSKPKPRPSKISSQLNSIFSHAIPEQPINIPASIGTEQARIAATASASARDESMGIKKLEEKSEKQPEEQPEEEEEQQQPAAAGPSKKKKKPSSDEQKWIDLLGMSRNAWLIEQKPSADQMNKFAENLNIEIPKTNAGQKWQSTQKRDYILRQAIEKGITKEKFYEFFPRKKGEGIDPSHKGLSDIEIDTVMKKFPQYLGTIAHNEINKLHINPRSEGGFIINTDPISKPGRHWQAIYFDARPSGNNEIDFYDSFGDPVDKNILKDLKDVANKLDAKTYLKFKENRIKQQSDLSSNCGFFCMKFLIDRFNGKPFKDASGYSDVLHGEGDIERFKAKFPPFQLMSSFQGGAELGFGSFTPFIEKHGDEVITSMIVNRTPISSGVNTLVKMITLGQSEAQSKKLGYDNLFHLAMNIKTNKGSSFSIDKTVSPHIGKYLTTGETMPVKLNKEITVKELIDNTIKNIGLDKFRNYDAINQNCQIFIEDILKSNSLLTPTLHSFIYQDVSSIFKNAPWFQKIARTVTDIGGFINKTLYGTGTSRVQSILFDQSQWTINRAVHWLNTHHFISTKIDKTDKYLRFRQFDPNPDSHHATKRTSQGITFILEY